MSKMQTIKAVSQNGTKPGNVYPYTASEYRARALSEVLGAAGKQCGLTVDGAIDFVIDACSDGLADALTAYAVSDEGNERRAAAQALVLTVQAAQSTIDAVALAEMHIDRVADARIMHEAGIDVDELIKERGYDLEGEPTPEHKPKIDLSKLLRWAVVPKVLTVGESFVRNHLNELGLERVEYDGRVYVTKESLNALTGGHTIMTAKDAASLLEVHKSTVYNLMDRGEIARIELVPGTVRTTKASCITYAAARV